MTREEAIKALGERVFIGGTCEQNCMVGFGVNSKVMSAVLDMAIAALRAEEGVAKLSEFLQEKLGEQESGSCKNCTDHGNCFQKGNGWISVEERLPDQDKFLGISKFSNKIHLYEKREWDKDWVVGGLYIPKDIRYWMPLSEPPKEEV